MADPVDTNVILRFLVETPETIAEPFRGVFPFFEKIERGEQTALLTPLVLFQAYFVLTSHYEVPPAEAASTLREIVGFKGLRIPEKVVLRACLDTLSKRSVDLVDAYLAALVTNRGLAGVHSFDADISKLGVKLLPVE